MKHLQYTAISAGPPGLSLLIEPLLREDSCELIQCERPSEIFAHLGAQAPELVIFPALHEGKSTFDIFECLKQLPLMQKAPIILFGEDSASLKGFPVTEWAAYSSFDKDQWASMLRRALGLLDSGTKLRLGDIEIDTIEYVSKANNEELDLTLTEYKLLKRLVERKGRVQTREHLLEHVWGYSSDIESRTIDTHVQRLRKKLGESGSYIQTIRGVGYKIHEKTH